MTALIFPGVLSVDKNYISVGIVGSAAAIILSWKKASITVVVIGAVLVNMVLYMILR